MNITKVYSIRNDILFKRAKKSLHMLHKPLGWCIDKGIFDEAKNSISYIQIYEVEENCFYTIPIDKFIAKSFIINRNFGEQYCCPILNWVRSNTPELLIVCRVPSLFDEVV